MTSAAALAAVLAAASCSAERAAPQPTRPVPTTAGAAAAELAPPAPAGTLAATPTGTDPGALATSTSTSTTTTTLPPPSADAWADFDEELRRTLIGSGNYSASVAVARHGELLHVAAFGVRVPERPTPTTTTTTTRATSPTAATTTTSTSSTTTTTTTATATTTTTTTTTPTARTTTPEGTGGPTTTSRPATSTTERPATTTAPSTTSTTSTSSSSTSTTLPPGDEPAEPSDRFRIASISKLVAAGVVLQLVEDGELDLGERVGERLADLVGVELSEPLVASVTVRQLLSHTSGFGVYENTFFGGDADSCGDAAARGLSRGLNSTPGTVYDYSNMNYCLLGLLVEDVTGEPYERVVRRRLLDPLGIDGMRMAGTFDPDPDEVEHPSVPGRVYMEALGAAGSWVATAADVVRIADALEPSRPGWHPLSTDTMALMRVPAPTAHVPAVRQQWYGLGEIVYADGSWGHTGTIENTHAMVLVRPDGVTWSILVSGEYPSSTPRLRDVFDHAVADAGIRL